MKLSHYTVFHVMVTFMVLASGVSWLASLGDENQAIGRAIYLVLLTILMTLIEVLGQLRILNSFLQSTPME